MNIAAMICLMESQDPAIRICTKRLTLGSGRSSFLSLISGATKAEIATNIATMTYRGASEVTTMNRCTKYLLEPLSQLGCLNRALQTVLKMI